MKEVVTIDRYEIIENKGKLIDQDLLARIQFYITSGDIKEVEVSNQSRQATLVKKQWLNIWSVTVSILRKKRRFLLYAHSIDMANEVIKDFIELNYDSSFEILSAKMHPNAVILTDKIKSALVEQTEDDSRPNLYYQIDVNVVYEYANTYTFIIEAKDVDSAMIVINHWIYNHLKKDQEDTEKEIEFTSTVASAVTIPCFRVIEQEFSAAYLDKSIGEK